MDEPHDLPGIFTVFFAVTQKNIRVKSGPYFRGKLITDQHGVQELLQFVFIRQCGRITVVLIQELHVSADTVEFTFQSALLHQGKNGNMLFDSIGEFKRSGRIVTEQKAGCHRYNKQLHQCKIRCERITQGSTFRFIKFIFNFRRIMKPDAGIAMGMQHLICDWIKRFGKVFRMSAEINTKFSLW